jgi:hypothetical protein
MGMCVWGILSAGVSVCDIGDNWPNRHTYRKPSLPKVVLQMSPRHLPELVGPGRDICNVRNL